MRYGSVCSGIEAATAAWHPLGWEPAFFSEIEPFPRAVLAHHYPNVPCHGDFTTIGADEYGPIDLLVGGTPCQSFSIAGLRGGMADDRGNLALEYIRLAHRKRARWVVWENVPGVFSSNGGEDFRCFLSGLVRWDVPFPEGGWQNAGVIAAGPADGAYGVAWRVLDAQFAGVPQRRRRVFVVGHLGDWRRAAAVLFERHSLSGHPAPRREAGKIAPTIPSRSTGGGGLGTDFDCDGGLVSAVADGAQWPAEVAPTLNAAFGSKLGLEDQHIRGGAECSSLPAVAMCLNAGAMGRQDAESETLIPVNRCGFDDALGTTHTLRGEGFDASEDGTGRGTPLVPVCFAADDYQSGSFTEVDQSAPITTSADRTRAAPVAVYPILEAGARTGVSTTDPRAGMGIGDPGDPMFTLQAGKQHAIAFAENQRGEVRTSEVVNLTVGGGKPGQGYPAVCFSAKDYGADAMEDCSPTLRAGGHDGSHQNGGVMPAVAFDMRGREGGAQFEGPHDTANIRAASGGSSRSYVAASAVRRLTPVECERLQGFSDNFTMIPWRSKPAEQCPDGPRYKALGNSMAIPVVRWLGERIQQVEEMTNGRGS